MPDKKTTQGGKRIDANDRRLTAVEWKSGPHLRIIDAGRAVRGSRNGWF